MPTDVPVDEVARDLKGWLDQLPGGEVVRLTDSDGQGVAMLTSLREPGGDPVSFEEWERRMRELAEEVSRAWKSEKSALEILAEMRR
jgi:hypothetical protein